MAKLFVIKFSPVKEKKLGVEVRNLDGEVEKVDLTIRDLEIVSLRTMFRLARNKPKSLEEADLIADCIDQLDNLNKKEMSIKFTKDDIKFLKTGFMAASGSEMINGWYDDCRNLMKQINEPQAEESSEEDKKETGKKIKKKKRIRNT